MYAVAIHGGAGIWGTTPRQSALAGVRHAAEAARDRLAQDGTALDAVTEAVRILEDDPLFNAGTGSVLNLDGEVEMDAGVMVGEGMRSGNVAALKRVQNPVLVARKVMELTDHVLLSGSGALRFARAVGFGDHDPVTAKRLDDWQGRRDELDSKRGDDRLAALHAMLAEWPQDEGTGTVGAVALDRSGGMAAATSTGGMALKLPGRIGDSALPGAGNFAAPHAAVSATGRGELMMRFLTAKAIGDDVASGQAAPTAVERILAAMRRTFGDDDVGAVALDAQGNVGIEHLTPAMPHAWFREGDREVTVRFARR